LSASITEIMMFGNVIMLHTACFVTPADVTDLYLQNKALTALSNKSALLIADINNCVVAGTFSAVEIVRIFCQMSFFNTFDSVKFCQISLYLT